MARAWLVHNIEEIGVLEHLPPEVIRQRPAGILATNHQRNPPEAP
jgi:hypothetical protein